MGCSVRSTNVYEEQALGLKRAKSIDEEAAFQPTGPRMSVWGRYFAMHARNQLYFGKWNLGNQPNSHTFGKTCGGWLWRCSSCASLR